jgi:hypothetical protein
MATTLSPSTNFGNFMYKGFIYALESELIDGMYQLSKMYKYDPNIFDLTPVAIYTFQKWAISAPRGHTTPYYGDKVSISVDEVGGQVLVVFTVAIIIDMINLSEEHTNYYKVFSETSEVACYQSGGTIYYAYREGANGYSGDDHTKYIPIADNHLDSIPAASNPGLTPLGSMNGLLIPGQNYYLSPSHYGFKTQSRNDGSIIAYTTPPGMARGYTPAVNYGSGPFWDHTWIAKFLYGDDGYAYVFIYPCWANSYFGLSDPLGFYDLCIIKYSIDGDGTFTEVARRLASEVFSWTTVTYINGYSVYGPVLSGCSIANGYLYFSTVRTAGNVQIGKLNCSDLSIVMTTTGVDPNGSPSNNYGNIIAWPQYYPNGDDVILYYCASGHLHFFDTDFVALDIDPMTINNYGGSFGFGQQGWMYVYEYRDYGWVIFPGWYEYLDFRTLTWGPDCIQVFDIPPQDMSEEILTNEFWGCGLEEAVVEETLTGLARQYAVDNDLLFSFVFDQQRSVLDGLQYIAQHHNGFYTTEAGAIAHRQLEIDDEEVIWQIKYLDAFDDGMTDTIWGGVGEDLRAARIVTQSIHFSESVAITKSIGISVIQTIKHNELATADLGVRFVSVVQTMAFVEDRIMNFPEKFVNVIQAIHLVENCAALVDPLIIQQVQQLAVTENVIVTDLNIPFATECMGARDVLLDACAGDFYSAVSGDDYEWYSGQFWGNLNWVGFGAHDQSYHAGIRFPSVTISSAYTITSAYIVFTGYQNDEGNDPHIHIYANNVDNAVAPTTVAQAEALALTSSIDYNPETWNQNVLYYTPDLSSIVSTVKNRGGWLSGNALQIIFRNQTAVASGHSRSAFSLDGSSTKKPKLHIEWIVSGGIALV